MTSHAEERSTEQAAFEYLVNVLNYHWDGPLELEIIGRSPVSPGAPDDPNYRILIDGRCVGIPEPLLSLSFLYARDCMLRIHDDASLDPLQSIAVSAFAIHESRVYI